VADGAFSDTNRDAFGGQDIRYTRNDRTVYAIVMAWPGADAVLPALGMARGLMGTVRSVDLLGFDGSVQWTHSADAMTVHLPAQPVGSYAITIRIRTA
jgi:alpha-L-fucosidase